MHTCQHMAQDLHRYAQNDLRSRDAALALPLLHSVAIHSGGIEIAAVQGVHSRHIIGRTAPHCQCLFSFGIWKLVPKSMLWGNAATSFRGFGAGSSLRFPGAP